MSTHDPFPEDRPDDAELQLRALFDATAEEPSSEQLHRLARTAAQIPERRASPLRAWLRRLAPGLALAAVAAAGWLLLASPKDVEAPSPTSRLAMSDDATAAPAPSEPAPSVPLIEDGDEALAIAVLDGELDGELDDDPDEQLGVDLDDPLAALGMGAALSDPMDDADLLFPSDEDEATYEIYNEALSQLLEEGG